VVDGVDVEFQFGSCTFMPKRKGNLELSYAQKNKWETGWTDYWFYVRVPGVRIRDQPDSRSWPLAFKRGEMDPFTRVEPTGAMDAERLKCDEAFGKACRYSSGRDLVEEMVAASFWPLEKRAKPLVLKKMRLPVFGSAEGEYVPCFGFQRDPRETDKEFVSFVEQAASLILGEVTEREVTSRQAILGNMPRLNRVFEEMGVHYGERVVVEKEPRRGGRRPAKSVKTSAAPIATQRAEAKRKREVAPVAGTSKRAKASVGKAKESAPSPPLGHLIGPVPTAGPVSSAATPAASFAPIAPTISDSSSSSSHKADVEGSEDAIDITEAVSEGTTGQEGSEAGSGGSVTSRVLERSEKKDRIEELEDPEPASRQKPAPGGGSLRAIFGSGDMDPGVGQTLRLG